MENLNESYYFQKQKEVFKPLLQKFYEQVKDLESETYPPAIFLPQVCEDYGIEGKKKVFYVGRDTYNWELWSEMQSKFSRNDYEKYLVSNNKYLTGKGYKENEKSVFWAMCEKIHQKFGFGNEFSAFGWGNRNSIELVASLENQHKNIPLWKDFGASSQNIYYKIKKASKNFDKLVYLLDVYQPDIVFILSWSNEGKKSYFDGLGWHLHNHNSTEKFKIRIYEISLHEKNIKVVWTEHPSSLRYKGVKIDEVVEKIKNMLDF
jgi:hypothetical protein